MKRAMLLGVVVGLGAGLLLTGAVSFAEEPAKDPKKAAEKTPGEGEMPPEMMEWMKYAEPGEHHEHLKPLAGKWDQAMRWRMAPDAEWTESKSQAQCTWVLGGRWLRQDVQGVEEEMPGQKFEGLGHLGYDNFKRKYVQLWMDNMFTGVMMGEGTCDPSGKVITVTGQGPDVTSPGKMKKFKWVTKIAGDDKHVFEMYDYTPEGQEYVSMEITSTRKM